MKRTLGRRIPQILFIIAIFLFVLVAILHVRSIGSLSEALNWDKHTQQVLIGLDETMIAVANAENGVRGFLITEDESVLEPFNQAQQTIENHLSQLRKLTADNPNQLEKVEELKSLTDNRISQLKTFVEARRRKSLEEMKAQFFDGSGRRSSREIRLLIGQMKEEENKLSDQRESELNKSVNYTKTMTYLAGFAGILFVGIAAFVNFREIGKRRKAEDDLRSANKSLEKRVDERTHELKQKNEELKDHIRQREQSEHYHRIALESGNLGAWRFDPKNDKAEIDERGIQIFGLISESFDGSGRSIFSRIHEEDLPLVQKEFQASLSEKKNFNAEFRVLAPDGVLRWSNCTGQPQLDENGEIAYLIGNCRDVTDGKESEIALRRSEKQVRNVIDSIFAFVAVLSPDGVLLEANRTALNAASLEAEAVIGKHFSETFWWSYSEDVQKQLNDSIEKAAAGESVRYDITVRTGEDKFIPIDFMIAPLYDEDGRITHLVPSGVDLTPRKEAEDALRKSENFANAILDSLSAHIAVVDKAGEIIAVNEAWKNFAESNCETDEIVRTGVGQNYLEVCRTAGESVSEAALILENLQSVLKGGQKVFSLEYPCHSPDEDRWFMLQISAMQGEDGGAVISHINITDRKKAEIKLRNSEQFNRSIFESSPDSVMILETDGKLHSINTSGLRLMEIEDFAPFVGKNWVDLWQEEENEMAYQAVQQAVKGKAMHFEGFRRTVKGNPKWWDVTVAPVFDSKGKPTLLISNSRDITERKEAERERERLLKNEKAARKDAEIANRLRDEFLATVSHELRAPLNSILGWGRLLEKGNLDEPTAEKAVATIVRNAESQNRLIEDLLDVSRIISGKLRLEVMTVKPVNIVEAALETIRPAAEAKGITLEIKEDSDVSHISGDPNRLQQVIWNLLSNAIKFTPNDGRVTLEIERENDFVNLHVKDTGVGIREEFLPHVFDRFSQADASSIRKFGGLGLGLAIVRHITEMHGGTVHVHSEGEGKGSIFTVRLPLIAESEDAEAVTNSKENLFGGEKPDLSLDGLLILVVDDEEDTRQLLAQALTFYGATVISAASAAEALSEIQDKNPDVLVSDIGMPEEDGYTLIRKVRSLSDGRHNKVAAVALTAFTRAQDRMRALSAGFQNHVSKPVEPDELVTVIASLTGRLHIGDEE